MTQNAQPSAGSNSTPDINMQPVINQKFTPGNVEKLTPSQDLLHVNSKPDLANYEEIGKVAGQQPHLLLRQDESLLK